MKILEAISYKAFKKSAAQRKVSEPTTAIYNITINRLDGTPLNLSQLKGKHVLFVNVASKCGFTGQYKELEQLYQKYKGKLMVIGLPCNQFGSQESGSVQQIQSFCERNYGVSFLITEKIKVKGKRQHSIYQWLTKKSLNGKKNSTVKWNFQKYLVDPDGKLIDFYYSITSPMSAKITKNLA